MSDRLFTTSVIAAVVLLLLYELGNPYIARILRALALSIMLTYIIIRNRLVPRD